MDTNINRCHLNLIWDEQTWMCWCGCSTNHKGPITWNVLVDEGLLGKDQVQQQCWSTSDCWLVNNCKMSRQKPGKVIIAPILSIAEELYNWGIKNFVQRNWLMGLANLLTNEQLISAVGSLAFVWKNVKYKTSSAIRLIQRPWCTKKPGNRIYPSLLDNQQVRAIGWEALHGNTMKALKKHFGFTGTHKATS